MAALLPAVPGAGQPTARAGEEYILRFATLAPRARRLRIEARKWQERVSDATGGRVKVLVYFGGSAGDEHAIVQKMRMGQFDAAGLSTIALSPSLISCHVLPLSSDAKTPFS